MNSDSVEWISGSKSIGLKVRLKYYFDTLPSMWDGGHGFPMADIPGLEELLRLTKEKALQLVKNQIAVTQKEHESRVTELEIQLKDCTDDLLRAEIEKDLALARRDLQSL